LSQLNFDHLLQGGFTPQTEADWDFLRAAAQNLFRPKAPIDDQKLFSGRIKQIQDVLDVVYEDGAHGVIFGERGVGKTSLANIIDTKVSPIIPSIKCIKVSCSPNDSFFDIWSNVFFDFEIEGQLVRDYLAKNQTAYSVYRVIEMLDQSRYHLIILDEFDRVRVKDTKIMMADLIKHFSNNPLNFTIMIVGVGDTLVDLFAGHESISRCCAQIKMQRMSKKELADIIDERVPKLGMSISEEVKAQIIRLSQGLPGYVHLLGQLSVRAAIDRQSIPIGSEHLQLALREALDKADYNTRQDYYKAVESPAKDNKYKEALLACALAETNELGMFFAGNVREPYSRIRGKPMEIAHFATHLNEFCSDDRGPALIRSGKRKRYQYRFANPLLQPLTVMVGVRDKMIPIDAT
jgi:Cdc6-like AAA superfamily ATPase